MHTLEECSDDINDEADIYENKYTCKICDRKWLLEWDHIWDGEDEWPLIVNKKLIEK